MADFYDILTHITRANDDGDNNSLKFITEFFGNPVQFANMVDLFSFVINKQTNSKCKKFILVYINTFLRRNDDVDIETLLKFSELICSSEFYKSKNDIRVEIDSARLMILWKVYPEIDRDFWKRTVQNNGEQILPIIMEFSEFTKFASGSRKDRFSKIKDSMREDGSDQVIAQFCIETFLQSSDSSLRALAALRSIMEWISMSFVFPYLQNILDKITAENYRSEVLSIFGVIAKRGMPDENKSFILNNFVVPLISNQKDNIGSFSFNEQVSFGNLISSVSSVLCEKFYNQLYDFAGTVFDISCQIFSTPDNENLLAFSVIPFLSDVISNADSEYETVSQLAIKRLTDYFADFKYDPDDPFVDRVIGLIKKCEQKNPEYVKNLVIDTPLNDINLFVTFLFIAKDLDVECPELVEKFQVCITDNSIDIGLIIYYVTILEKNKSKITNPIDYLICMVQRALQCENLPEAVYISIRKFAKSFSDKFQAQFDVQAHGDVLNALIQSNNKYFVETAVCLVNSTRSIDFSKQITDKIFEICRNSQGSYIACFLRFIRRLNFFQNQDYCKYLENLLIQTKGVCFSDSSLFSEYIKASQFLSTEMIIECANVLLDNYNTMYGSMGALFDVLKAVYSDKNKNSFGNFFFDKFIQCVIVMSSELKEEDWFSSKKSQETKDVVDILKSFYLMMIKVLQGGIDQAISEGCIQSLLNFTGELFSRRYNIPDLYIVLCTFYPHLTKIDARIVIEFVPASLSVLNFRKFNPEIREWSLVADKLITMHNDVLNIFKEMKNQELCIQYIENLQEVFVNKFGLDQELVQRYISLLGQDGDQRIRRMECKKFYVSVSKILDSVNF